MPIYDIKYYETHWFSMLVRVEATCRQEALAKLNESEFELIEQRLDDVEHPLGSIESLFDNDDIDVEEKPELMEDQNRIAEEAYSRRREENALSEECGDMYPE